MGIIVCAICLVLSIIFFIRSNKKITYNKDIDEQNKKLQLEIEENQKLLNKSESELFGIEEEKREVLLELDDLIKKYDNIVKNQKEMADEALKSYCDNLEYQYKREKQDHDNKVSRLSEEYDKKKIEIQTEFQITKDELDKLKATFRAIQEAEVRKKEVENNSEFYSITIDESELADIAVLSSIKNKLRKPRVLSMLIWQTFWQKPLKAMAADVLGTSTVMGVYKITNKLTNEVYIGQAVDVSKRWSEHAKAGLGIDTPAGNKLYKAMEEYGLESFTWELLEKCLREQLNEKEKYYIDLYDSYNRGYNSNKGNK